VDGGATLTVSDDGCGFDPREIAGGMGLSIMRERLQRIAGTFFVETAPGRGTTIHAAWPSTAYDGAAPERMGA
jgi:signal transduction histidine kinase